MKEKWDVRAYLQKFTHIFVKYQYVILAAAVGLCLLAWPSDRKKSEEPTSETLPAAELPDTAEMESRLTVLLSRVDGVGRVEVMLSLAGDVEYIYAEEYTHAEEETDEENGASSASVQESTKYTTVRLGTGDETPVLLTRRYPAYQGAAVVCDGADQAGVRLKIINAVSALTGLGSDSITVMKMKG